MTGSAQDVHDVLAHVLLDLHPGRIVTIHRQQEALDTAHRIVALLRDHHGLTIQPIPDTPKLARGGYNPGIVFNPSQSAPLAPARGVHRRPEEPAESVNESGGNVGGGSVSPTDDARARTIAVQEEILALFRQIEALFADALRDAAGRAQRDARWWLEMERALRGGAAMRLRSIWRAGYRMPLRERLHRTGEWAAIEAARWVPQWLAYRVVIQSTVEYSARHPQAPVPSVYAMDVIGDHPGGPR